MVQSVNQTTVHYVDDYGYSVVPPSVHPPPVPYAKYFLLQFFLPCDPHCAYCTSFEQQKVFDFKKSLQEFRVPCFALTYTRTRKF